MVPWQPEVVNVHLAVNDNDSSAEGGSGLGFGSVDAADSLMSDGFVVGGQQQQGLVDGDGSVGQLTAGTAANNDMQRSDGGGGSPEMKRTGGAVQKQKKKGNASASTGGSAVLQETSILSSARWVAETA